jgi:hypothetical protein
MCAANYIAYLSQYEIQKQHLDRLILEEKAWGHLVYGMTLIVALPPLDDAKGTG